MSQKTVAKREVTIIARYTIKRDHKQYKAGSIVLLVENDKGVRYTVTLRRTHDHSCTCKAVKPCYHIEQCRAIENARAARPVAATLAREVEAICAEAEKELARETPMRDLAPLNGVRAFSLMR